MVRFGTPRGERERYDPPNIFIEYALGQLNPSEGGHNDIGIIYDWYNREVITSVQDSVDAIRFDGGSRRERLESVRRMRADRERRMAAAQGR